MLHLKNISQEYIQGDAKVSVLSNLFLNIKSRKNIGIIGPSGSGKTTLLNIIGLLENPKKGEVFINDKSCHDLSLEEKTNFRKNNIGYVFQNNQLLEDFNVIENLALPLILNGLSYKKSFLEAEKFLSILKLESRKSFKPGLLSGGEQQRVSVARALIKKPQILIADEPTGSLDENTSNAVFNLILDLASKNKGICIIATHNLKLIKKLDLCYKIEKGLLIEYN